MATIIYIRDIFAPFRHYLADVLTTKVRITCCGTGHAKCSLKGRNHLIACNQFVSDFITHCDSISQEIYCDFTVVIVNNIPTTSATTGIVFILA